MRLVTARNSVLLTTALVALTADAVLLPLICLALYAAIAHHLEGGWK